MALRFRRVIALLPWLRVNVSKRGVSASVGPRGLSANVGPDGITRTVGLPGTGLSERATVYRFPTDDQEDDAPEEPTADASETLAPWAVGITAALMLAGVWWLTAWLASGQAPRWLLERF